MGFFSNLGDTFSGKNYKKIKLLYRKKIKYFKKIFISLCKKTNKLFKKKKVTFYNYQNN